MSVTASTATTSATTATRCASARTANCSLGTPGGSVVIWDVGCGRQQPERAVGRRADFLVVLRPDRARDLRQRRGRDRRSQLLHDHRTDRHRRRDDRRRVGPVAPTVGNRADHPAPPGQPDAQIPEGQISVAHAPSGPDRRGRARHQRIPFLHRHLGHVTRPRCSPSCAPRRPGRFTQGEWQTYFPGEPYDPACSPNQAVDVAGTSTPRSRPASAVTKTPARAKVAAPSRSSPAAAVASGCRVAGAVIPPQPKAAGFAWRSRYIRSTPKSFAAGRCPT